LDTFDKLKRVGGTITVADNKQLAELKGFNELKYIGSACLSRPENNQHLNCCGCTVDNCINWDLLFVRNNCNIDVCFDITIFDGRKHDCSFKFPCAYELPVEFFDLTCETLAVCPNPSTCSSVTVVDYSLIIFRNNRLRAIGGFANLKQVNSIIYIIDNVVLHTIHAFGQLAFALDIWIRNNANLKYIIGFNNLLSIRELVCLESVCLVSWDNIKSLEFAQNIYLESKTAKSVKFPKTPIPSVMSYALYYSYSNQC